MRIWGSEDIWESVLSLHPVGRCVVMLVCVRTYLWRLEDNFWESILSFHPCFQGTDSVHQACVASTFTHFAIAIASTLFFRFIVRYLRAVGTRVSSNIYLSFSFSFVCFCYMGMLLIFGYWFFLNDLFIYFVCMKSLLTCMYVYHASSCCIPWNRGGCESSCGCWDSNPGSFCKSNEYS